MNSEITCEDGNLADFRVRTAFGRLQAFHSYSGMGTILTACPGHPNIETALTTEPLGLLWQRGTGSMCRSTQSMTQYSQLYMYIHCTCHSAAHTHDTHVHVVLCVGYSVLTTGAKGAIIHVHVILILFLYNYVPWFSACITLLRVDMEMTRWTGVTLQRYTMTASNEIISHWQYTKTFQPTCIILPCT